MTLHRLQRDLYEIDQKLEVARHRLQHAQLEVDMLTQRRRRIITDMMQPPLEGWT